MPMTFYPHEDDLETSSLEVKIEVMMEGAQRFKAIMLDPAQEQLASTRQGTPRDLTVSYNWEEIARLLRDIRELQETSSASKLFKADCLTKLAEVYEVLRAAKMPKLEAVRLALMNEATQLRSSAAQVA